MTCHLIRSTQHTARSDRSMVHTRAVYCSAATGTHVHSLFKYVRLELKSSNVGATAKGVPTCRGICHSPRGEGRSTRRQGSSQHGSRYCPSISDTHHSSDRHSLPGLLQPSEPESERGLRHMLGVWDDYPAEKWPSKMVETDCDAKSQGGHIILSLSLS